MYLYCDSMMCHKIAYLGDPIDNVRDVTVEGIDYFDCAYPWLP